MILFLSCGSRIEVPQVYVPFFPFCFWGVLLHVKLKCYEKAAFSLKDYWESPGDVWKFEALAPS